MTVDDFFKERGFKCFLSVKEDCFDQIGFCSDASSVIIKYSNTIDELKENLKRIYFKAPELIPGKLRYHVISPSVHFGDLNLESLDWGVCVVLGSGDVEIIKSSSIFYDRSLRNECKILVNHLFNN